MIELSHGLNALTLHPERPDAARFRNPNGVALKLANFAALDPNYPVGGDCKSLICGNPKSHSLACG